MNGMRTECYWRHLLAAGGSMIKGIIEHAMSQDKGGCKLKLKMISHVEKQQKMSYNSWQQYFHHFQYPTICTTSTMHIKSKQLKRSITKSIKTSITKLCQKTKQFKIVNDKSHNILYFFFS